MTFRLRIHVVFTASAIGLGGCDAAESRYDVVDTPTPVPSKVEGPPRPPDEVAEPDPELVAKCVRGTGRNAEGECEALRRQELDYVQRIQLPRGDFVMGDIPVRYDASKTRKDPKSSWSGNPPRQARVEALWLDLHEVTRSAYAKCVADGKCTEAKCQPGQEPTFKQTGEELGEVPQTCVTHAQAEAFCQAYGGRLPTEAEWEFAARGVDARIFPWGNEVRDEYPASAASRQRPGRHQLLRDAGHGHQRVRMGRRSRSNSTLVSRGSSRRPFAEREQSVRRSGTRALGKVARRQGRPRRRSQCAVGAGARSKRRVSMCRGRIRPRGICGLETPGPRGRRCPWSSTEVRVQFFGGVAEVATRKPRRRRSARR